MLFLLVAVLLTGTALLYFSDRQQRALAQPLPAAARLAGVILVVGSFAGWGWRLGPGVGLFTACWVFALGAISLPMLVGHLVDGYRRPGASGERA
ncbi:MAG: hypothetical protein VYC49_15590 [Pseudomonadota bacterium]|jgi:hypothetical protein|nr:hypothetical protein [Pseudomonadota bacterium]|tara:strand:+ start:103269 stop:103553 length:285 start_codon:yes stop_codon:yes gene_type:complete